MRENFSSKTIDEYIEEVSAQFEMAKRREQIANSQPKNGIGLVRDVWNVSREWVKVLGGTDERRSRNAWFDEW